MKVTVCYFASMRDVAGCDREARETSAANLGELFDECRSAHGFRHTRAELAVALDDELAAWDTALAEAAEVSFLPPVSGG